LIQIFDFAFFVFAGVNLQPKTECYSEVETADNEQENAAPSVNNQENATTRTTAVEETVIETENSAS
jgi:hypothetical protein